MKKVFFALLALCISTSVFAQTKFTTYSHPYDGKDYSVQVSTDKSGSYKLWIDAMSLEGERHPGGLMLTEKQHPLFVESLGQAKAKYQEWYDLAVKNNVTDVRKQMEITTRTGAYFSYGDWQFDYIVGLQFEFLVITSEGITKRLLIVRTGKLTSSTNQYMEVDGYAMVFTEPKEIEEFLSLTSPEKIREFLAKPKTEEIFK